jgi:hypothetical protein
VTYPLAGRLGAAAGLPATFLTLGALALLAVLAALQVWPTSDPEALDHTHPDLAPDDPHFRDTPPDGRGHHVHAFVIDDRHVVWPRPA